MEKEKQERKQEGMTAAAREAQREYQRKYRKAHPEKVKQWADNYWNRKAEQAAAAECAEG